MISAFVMKELKFWKRVLVLTAYFIFIDAGDTTDY